MPYIFKRNKTISFKTAGYNRPILKSEINVLTGGFWILMDYCYLIVVQPSTYSEIESRMTQIDAALTSGYQTGC